MKTDVSVQGSSLNKVWFGSSHTRASRFHSHLVDKKYNQAGLYLHCRPGKAMTNLLGMVSRTKKGSTKLRRTKVGKTPHSEILSTPDRRVFLTTQEHYCCICLGRSQGKSHASHVQLVQQRIHVLAQHGLDILALLPGVLATQQQQQLLGIILVGHLGCRLSYHNQCNDRGQKQRKESQSTYI